MHLPPPDIVLPLTYHQILAELKQKKFRPVYLLAGKEPYFIDQIAGYIEKHALAEHEKAFNQVILYGRDVDHLAVIDNARRFPMMADRQLVIVKEAQDMKDLNELEKYLAKPSQTTMLVLCHKHKSFNKKTRLAKLVEEHGIYFDSSKLYDNQIPDWIRDQLKMHKLNIDSQTASLLAEYLGTDLSLISHELEKLALHLSPGAEVTPEEVERHIGISREYNIFELQKAISTRHMDQIARITQNFIANPKRNPFIMVISSLASFFTRLYMLHFLQNRPEEEILKAFNLRSAYFLREYRTALRHFSKTKTEKVISLLKEYDLKSKGVDYSSTGKEEGELLKELIWQIMHA